MGELIYLLRIIVVLHGALVVLVAFGIWFGRRDIDDAQADQSPPMQEPPPEFSWPPYPPFIWPTIPQFHWPALPVQSTNTPVVYHHPLADRMAINPKATEEE